MTDVPLNELLILAGAIVAGGVVAGLLAGLFGVGGGVVVVPVLYEVFRLLEVPDAVHMQLCIGTSLAIMVPTNIRSYRAHRASGAVLTDVVRQWTPGIIVGIAVGAAIATVAPSPVFKIGFVSLIGFALLAPVASLTASYGARLAHALPRRGLEVAFGMFLLAASLRFLASLV
ncbi:MAG: TSUP family transporter [Burkholderiales bacterium]